MSSGRLIGLVLVMAGCSSPQVGTKYVKTGTIGTAGGTLTVAASDDPALAGTSITIPAGALTQSVLITIAPSSEAVAQTGQTAAGPVVDFGPDGLTFSTAVTLSIPATLPSGTVAAELAVEAVESNGDVSRLAVTSFLGGLATFQASGFTHFGGVTQSASDAGEDGGCSGVISCPNMPTTSCYVPVQCGCPMEVDCDGGMPDAGVLDAGIECPCAAVPQGACSVTGPGPCFCPTEVACDGGATALDAGSLDAGSLDAGSSDAGSLACNEDLASYCAQNTCVEQWAAAEAQACTMSGGVSEGICGSYDVITDFGVDSGTTYYYDAQSGNLVAVVTYVVPSIQVCQAGPSTFAPPSACTTTVLADCATDAGPALDAGTGDGDAGCAGSSISLSIDSAPAITLASNCANDDRGNTTAIAYRVEGGAAPGVDYLDIDGCVSAASGSEGLTLSLDDAQNADDITSGSGAFTDSSGATWSVSNSTVTVGLTEDQGVGGVVAGSFNVTVSNGSASHVLTGSFDLCHTQDLLAP